MYSNKQPTILIVDDSEINRSMLTDILSPEYAVLQAGDGQAAVDIIQNHHSSLALVLLDIMMPVMDGYGVLSYMREWGFLSEIPVIVLSSANDLDCVRDAYAAGASEFMDKTFDDMIIRNRVGVVIKLFQANKMRTVEQERLNGYEELAKVIKFEYDKRTDRTTLFPYGAKVLSLPAVMENPLNDERIYQAMDKADHIALADMLHSTSPSSPYVYYKCKLHINGEDRHYQAALQAIWNGESSPARYEGCIGTLIDIDVFEREAAKWSVEAQVDALTGLLRPNYGRECIEQRLADREGNKFLFIFFDLDNFKQANDTYGHEFGNSVLAHVGLRLRETVRSGDILVRLGGDEFAVFMEYSSDPVIAVDRIFSALCGKFGGKFDISLSMGVAVSESVGVSYQDLHDAADKAMYAAKRAGKGMYSFSPVTCEESVDL